MRIHTRLEYEFKNGQYVLTHEEGFEYSGPLALCCGPSAAMKALNTQISSFSGTMVNEAKTIFGDASSMFNQVASSVGKIITGGPSQQGWGAAQSAAVTSGIINAAATAGRNIKSAIGSVIGAIGGGNTVAPSGAMANVVASSLENVENQKTQQEEQATIANYQQGNLNYENAIGAAEKAPSMLDTANTANANAMGGLQTAQKSQASTDAASNWWQPLVMKGIGAAASIATGGMSNIATSGFGGGGNPGGFTNSDVNAIMSDSPSGGGGS